MRKWCEIVLFGFSAILMVLAILYTMTGDGLLGMAVGGLGVLTMAWLSTQPKRRT